MKKPNSQRFLAGIMVMGAFLMTTLSFLPVGKAAAEETEEPLFEEMPIPANIVQGVDTHFEVVGTGEFPAIVLDTSLPVEAWLESNPDEFVLGITSVSDATRIQVTLSGLIPNTTYYRYLAPGPLIDPLITDSAGTLNYTVDLVQPHVAMIRTDQRTLYLLDNATGGDCSMIGNWDGVQKTCTLNAGVSDWIYLASPGLTLDGAGYGAVGVAAWQPNVTVRNYVSAEPVTCYGVEDFKVENSVISRHSGIDVSYCPGTTIAGNSLMVPTDSPWYRYAIYVVHSPGSIIVENSIDVAQHPIEL